MSPKCIAIAAVLLVVGYVLWQKYGIRSSSQADERQGHHTAVDPGDSRHAVRFGRCAIAPDGPEVEPGHYRLVAIAYRNHLPPREEA
jgi:hypothetical protein